MRATDELVTAARSGDASAFEDLVRAHAQMVFRVALRIVRDREDAEDVAQRALLSAWRGLSSFRGDAGFATWLHRITVRHALNCVSRRVVLLAIDDVPDLADPGDGPAQTAVARDGPSAVQLAVAGLPEQQRKAVRMYHLGGFSYAQIASHTGTSVPAVRSHLFRARRALATTLADEMSSAPNAR